MIDITGTSEIAPVMTYVRKLAPVMTRYLVSLFLKPHPCNYIPSCDDVKK